MGGATCLSLLGSLGSIKHVRRGLASLWRSLSPQHRRVVMTLLLAGFLAEMQQRWGLWQKVKGGRGETECHALQQQGGRPAQEQGAGRGRGKRGYSTRPVVLGDRGRARTSWALRQQYLSRANCDVTFSVDGRSFSAHRCWVAAFSMPLRAMFNSGMRESQENVIHLHDTDAATFELLLDFIYDGAVELNEYNIESLLELSARYAVGPLVEQCCDFLAGTIDTTNGFGILTLADKYNCHPLRRDTLLFVVVNFDECWACDRDGFRRLSKPLVVDILSHDGLVPLGGEETVFRAGLAWLEAEGQARSSGGGAAWDEDLVKEIMSHVRFPLIAPEVLAEQIETHAVMQMEACREYVLEAYRFQALMHGSSVSPTSSLASASVPSPASASRDDQVRVLPRCVVDGMGARARKRVALVAHIEQQEQQEATAAAAAAAAAAGGAATGAGMGGRIVNSIMGVSYEVPRAAEVSCSRSSTTSSVCRQAWLVEGGGHGDGEDARRVHVMRGGQNVTTLAAEKAEEGRINGEREGTDYDHLFFGGGSSGLLSSSPSPSSACALVSAKAASRTVSV